MFVQFVLEPMWKLYDQIMSGGDPEQLNKMLKAINVAVKDITVPPKQLIRDVMSTWLPIDKSIMGMITRTLPSPVDAQHHRLPTFSQELSSSSLYAPICACDPTAPVATFVSKMMPIDPNRDVVVRPGEPRR
jgi:translation elongation factor EF-G